MSLRTLLIASLLIGLILGPKPAVAFPGGFTHIACCAGVIGLEITATTVATGGAGGIFEVLLGTGAGIECMTTGCAQFWWAGMIPMPVCTWTFAIPPPF